MSIEKHKSEIIQELLFKQIQNISKKYKDYLKISMGDVYLDCSDGDYIIDIFIDNIYDIGDFNNEDMYILYLNDFMKECDKLVNEIDKQLPKHLWFSDNWNSRIVGYDKIYYTSKSLQFKVLDE